MKEQLKKWRGWIEQIESLESQAETANDEIKAERIREVSLKLKQKLMSEIPEPSSEILEIMKRSNFDAALYYCKDHIPDTKIANFVINHYNQITRR